MRQQDHGRAASRDVHGPHLVYGSTGRSGCVHSASMKKLLILVVLVALAAVAAKKVRTV